jgi:parallel beta-helix repeat protein
MEEGSMRFSFCSCAPATLRWLNVLLIGCVSVQATAADINVPADHATIQAAIVAANPGDVVIVAPGTYLEAIDFLGKAITVRSTDPNDIGVVMATIIDGNGADHVVQCVNSEGPDTILSGFVITGGNANGGGSNNDGGGMYNFNSSPTVTNCSFSGNEATSLGGGMYNEGGNPTVTNCLFHDNSAVGGGGMTNFNSSPTLTNSSFLGNSANSVGGGIHNFFSSPTLTNCSFSGNTANSDGGGMYSDSGSPTLTNCSFSGNTSVNAGGGGMYNVASSSTVSNCSFSGNTANSNGGGMYNVVISPTVSNTGFCNNTPNAINGTYNDGGGNSLAYCPPLNALPPACPSDLFGGCCLDGVCLDEMSESNCLALGGTFFGEGVTCAMSDCTNDWCYAATPIVLGNTPFNTIGATTDGPINIGCDDGDGTHFVNDIWFEYTASTSGTLTVLTCDQATFDTIIAAYTGSCGSLNLVNCDDEGCGIQTSVMNFDVTAGETYLLRVGGYFPSGLGGSFGVGTLTLSLAPCPADFTGAGDGPPDGTVDVLDLLALLAAWGACP